MRGLNIDSFKIHLQRDRNIQDMLMVMRLSLCYFVVKVVMRYCDVSFICFQLSKKGVGVSEGLPFLNVSGKCARCLEAFLK